MVLALISTISSCDSSKHDEPIDMVSQLPEVSHIEESIKTSSDGRAVLKLWVHEEPSENVESHWWIKIGEDNGESLSTHINLKLNETGTQIWFYEILSDSLIPLDDWRKSDHYPFK